MPATGLQGQLCLVDKNKLFLRRSEADDWTSRDYFALFL